MTSEAARRGNNFSLRHSTRQQMQPYATLQVCYLGGNSCSMQATVLKRKQASHEEVILRKKMFLFLLLNSLRLQSNRRDGDVSQLRQAERIQHSLP